MAFINRTWLFLLCLSWTFEGDAQTCCSGGVPVSSNLGFASENSGMLQVGVSADFTVLKSLFAGATRIEDEMRTRSTQSYLLRAAYQLSNSLSVEGLLPYVRQTRTIYHAGGNTDFEQTRGVGDAVVLAIYDVHTRSSQARLGVGTRIPLGASDRRNQRGLILVEDLQPGSGAWDILLYGSFSSPLVNRQSASFHLTSIYRIPGTNTESRAGNQAYRFGNDLQLIAGYQDQLFALDQVWTAGAALRFRHVERDRVDGLANSGTGGRFLFIRLSPGVTLDRYLLAASLEVPIYRNVNETQLAPTISVAIGCYVRLDSRKSSVKI